MARISMLVPQADPLEAVQGASPEPLYPWGLQLFLSEEQITALNIGALPQTGESFDLDARVKVSASAENPTTKNAGRSITLQITDMALIPLAHGKDKSIGATAGRLYTKMPKGG